MIIWSDAKNLAYKCSKLGHHHWNFYAALETLKLQSTVYDVYRAMYKSFDVDWKAGTWTSKKSSSFLCLRENLAPCVRGNQKNAWNNEESTSLAQNQLRHMSSDSSEGSCVFIPSIYCSDLMCEKLSVIHRSIDVLAPNTDTYIHKKLLNHTFINFKWLHLFIF